METIKIYTDGACSGNPGPGGWGAMIVRNDSITELSGGEEHTTNNRMELTAVFMALREIKEACVIDLYSDSKYVIDSLKNGWASGWRKRGWVKSDGKKALNPDLWDMVLDMVNRHEMRYHWVKGHADNPRNNRCDELAVAESKKFILMFCDFCDIQYNEDGKTKADCEKWNQLEYGSQRVSLLHGVDRDNRLFIFARSDDDTDRYYPRFCPECGRKIR